MSGRRRYAQGVAIPFRTKTFGRFELQARVGSGGMAEVFKAVDSRSGELVALKRMLPSLDDEEGAEDLTPLFQAEARIGATLRHPHIAQLLDFGRVGEFFYITFEFIDGRDLAAIQGKLAQRGEAMEARLACGLVVAIADALRYAHERRDADGALRPVVHRDVSPQNVLVGQDGSVKLIDFGVAKDVEGGTGRTQVGNVRGKFGYLAPEQVDGAPVDARTDVFALAVVLWELLAGTRLFHADNEFLAVQRLKGHVPADLATLRSDVPPALAAVVARGLEKAPERRYESMASFRDALRDASGVASAEDLRPPLGSLMERLFGDSHSHVGQPPSSRAAVDEFKVSEEKRAMSGDEKQSGKPEGEVDVFEALSQKRRSLPPPAPSGANLKGTMLGVANPLAGAPLPPPPPPPAPAPASAKPASVAPAAAAPNAPNAPNAVEWEEDEDEATHVFDKNTGDAANLMAAAFQTMKKEPEAAPEATPAPARTLFGVTAPVVTAPVVTTATASPASTATPPPAAPAVDAPNSYALIQSASVPVNAPNPLLQTSASPSIPAPAMPASAPVPSFAPPAPAAAGNSWGLIGGLAVIAVAAGAFLLMPKHGKLVVNVADSRDEAIPTFDVLVDGEAVCSSLPCVREKVPVGTITVTVQAQGFKKPAAKTVSIENGKASTVEFKLTADAPVPPAAPAAPAAPGPAAAAPEAPAAAPAPAPVAAPVAPASAPAAAPAPAPAPAPAVAAPKPAPAAPAAPVAPTVAATPKPAPAPAPAPAPTPAPVAKPVVAAPSPAAAGSTAGMGTLTINSLPASSVKVDGKGIGSTPIKNYTVKAGKHTITFENAEEGLTKTIEVDVAPGEDKKAIAKLRSE